MTKITQINRDTLPALRLALQAKLNEFAAEHGLNASSFGIKFTDTSFEITKATFGLSNPGEVQIDPRHKIDLMRRGAAHGLTVEMIGREVIVPTRKGLTKFKFLGMKNSKVIMEALSGDDKGKSFLFNAEFAAAHYLTKV